MKRMSIIVGGTLVVTALLGSHFFAQAEESVQHYKLCMKRTNGIYEDNVCRRITGVEKYEKYDGSSTPENIKSEGSTAFQLETESALIKCTTTSGTGTAWNPEPFESSSGESKDTVTFEGCTVAKPSGCTIPGGKVVTNELHGVMEGSEEYGPGVRLKPVSGTVFVEIVFEGKFCSLGKKVAVKGSAFGIAENETSSLVFTSKSSELTLGESKATLTGEAIQREAAEGSFLLEEP